MDAVASLISSVGFPIVIALLMAWYIKYINDKHSEETRLLNEAHKAEMSDTVQAINNNTLAVQKLVDTLNPIIQEITRKGES